MRKRNYKNLLIILINTVFLASPLGGIFSLAEIDEDYAQQENIGYSIYLDEPTIAKGYTVTAFNDDLKLSLVPGILSEATRVDVIQLNEILPWPWRLDKISQVYQFEFLNKVAYDDYKPFYIQFNYQSDDKNYKQVFFYDKNFMSWRPLPTQDFPGEGFVRSLIHLPFARIAVFSHPQVMTTGRASWYAYKPGNFAASPDFPKGSRLKVTQFYDGDSVEVEINDFGPDRALHPDRVVDLEKNAFARLASLGAGMLEVHVQPLYVAPDADGRILGIDPDDGVGETPKITSRAAIVMDEATEKIIYEKNATATLPIASLVKIVAIKVFFDTKPSLNNLITYSLEDEEYNYQYVKKWESARLDLEEGDQVTIEDLVYVSLVGSANNTIESLVRVSGLSREAFIAKMNSTVRGWGAVSTNFVEPTGLAPENVSSAKDYAIISKETLKHPIIAKSSTMAEYEFTIANTEEKKRVRNTNHIIRTNKFNLSGSKTGYLDEALYCLMTRVNLGARSLIVVTLGTDTRDISFTETSDLMLYGARN